MDLRFGRETGVPFSSWLLAMVRHLTSHCLNCKMKLMASGPFINRDVERMRRDLSEENTMSSSWKSHAFFLFKLSLRSNTSLKMLCVVAGITTQWYCGFCFYFLKIILMFTT